MKLKFSIRKRAAFTLVEIALALAIIGFALVAIIGVLPFGLNVQKENREETIVVQDANYFMNALRSGARGLDDLTNYVEAITNYATVYEVLDNNGVRTTNILFGPDTYGYTFASAAINNNDHPENVITNGRRIIGLLSTPRFLYDAKKPVPVPARFVSNYVFAYVRALSGPSVEKAPQTNSFVRDLAFRYRLIIEVNPYGDWNLDWVDFTLPGLSPEEIVIRSNAWRFARGEQANMNEFRLLFRWPVDSKRVAGSQRQVFRTLVGGVLQQTNHVGLPIWLMQQTEYQAAQ